MKTRADRKLHRINIVLILTFCIISWTSSGIHAQEGTDNETALWTLAPIDVVEPQTPRPVISPSTSTVGTTNTIDRATIDLGGAEQTNLYKAISMQPGVDVRFNDPFGMSVSHRIRGKSDRNIGETVEGLPLKGIGPGGALATMMDLENIQAISIFKGAVSADNGFGYGSDSGMVDMHMLRPRDEAHGTARQVFGSDDFSRTYLRADTGDMGRMVKAFVSASYTDADKWKGEGNSPDGRKNVAVGLAGSADLPIQWEIYGVHNDQKKHNYRGLTYAQSRDLSANRDLDYRSSLSGNSAEDISYYDYNREEYQTTTVFGKISVPLTDKLSVVLRPYYLHDEGFSYSGSGGKVVDWMEEQDSMGGVLECGYAIDQGLLKAGVWYGEDEAPGPPTSKKYRSTNDLKFLGWERLVEVDNHKFTSPFVTAEKTFGATTLSAGLRYLWQIQPDLTSYVTTGLPDVDYEEALDLDPDVSFDVHGQTHEAFLPNIGITHDLTDNVQLRASYGRTYNSPEYSLGSQLVNFKAKGLSDAQLQRAWDSLELETGDNFDVGVNYVFDNGFVSATAFYSLVENVGGNFYDPDLKISYYQNTADAQSYGLELAASYAITQELNVSSSVTYTQYQFTTDIEAVGGSTIKSKGHQIPNVPDWLVNVSLDWERNGYRISPIVRYMDKRYVDVENKYTVDSCFLVDLVLSKSFNITEKQALTVSLSVTNALDEEYISDISSSDTFLGQETTYTFGAPRTFFIGLKYDI